MASELCCMYFIIADANILFRSLLELSELFEDAIFSKDVSAVLASEVFPDCRAVLRVFSNEFMLDAVEVESVDEVLPVLDESS